MRTASLAALLGLLLATRAGAQDFPARSGELGIIDVPDAEVSGQGRSRVAAELRFDRVAGSPDDYGALPIYWVVGIANAIDLGLTFRDWGQAGDPRPTRMLLGAAAKLQLLEPRNLVPGVAVSTVLDKVNEATVASGRLAVSTSDLPVRLAGFLGFEYGTGAEGKMGPSAGVAASLPLGDRLNVDAEALLGPRGKNYGAALRYGLTRTAGVSLGANYLPDDEGLRVAVTFAIWPARSVKAGPAPTANAPPPEEEVAAGAAAFTDDRPRFRLRMPLLGPQLLALARHQQHGPFSASQPSAVSVPTATSATKAAAPSLEDLAEAQVREQEALADARERRIRSTSDQLDAREKAALDEAKRLEDRERDLTVREQQLDARERRIVVRGAPTQQQRQLESVEAQLAAQERQLLAQERSLAPAIDAARGRERDASTREESERQEATRLAASATSATNRAQQVELRKQVLAARNRQMASLEARLVARGERIDALERQNRAKGERLDAWSRRLDTRGERLDLLDKRASDSRPAPAQKPPVEAKPGVAAKDKAVFVMVVKSPTAIVKERGAAAAAPQAGTALHPGVAVEKAVAAATVVSFPTPASQLSELDRETVDNIAKLAAKERCELLIWARAKDPGLMADAQRRADEIKSRAISAGPLDAKQVVTRITTRPGAQGVDVVVSALRETSKPATQAPTPAPSGPALLAGESGKRQIREAVVAAQPSIEACVGEHIEKRKLQRVEGSLKLSISPQGRVTKVTTGGNDLGGSEIEECLGRASGAWAFPSADANYVIDVPITVVRGGTR